MDEFIKKRLGILILGILGLLTIPMIAWLMTLPISGAWITSIIGIWALLIIFFEEIVRHYFNIPKLGVVVKPEETPEIPT